MRDIWKWLGENSGQIQILIALTAFWLAYLGYKRVLQQIKMAEDQSAESETQTRHFADQVKEAAKQTGLAAQQLSASNVQIQEVIDHRNLVLGIRTEELKSECVDMCIKSILSIQDTVELLSSGIKKVEKRIATKEIDETSLESINNKIEGFKKDIEELSEKNNELLKISSKLATNSDPTSNENLYNTLMVIKLVYLTSIRTANHYLGVEALISSLLDLYELPN